MLFKNLIYLCYSFFLFCLVFVGLKMNLNEIFYIIMLAAGFQMFFFQIKKLNIKDPRNCLKIFKSNNFLGIFIFTALLFGKINIS